MNYYEGIKQELINNEVYKKVKDYSKNKSDLSTYYNVGKLLIEVQGGEERAKYGDNLIKEYSGKLTNELGKGYSTRSLKRMRKFYLYIKKGTALLAQLSWSHYIEILSLKEKEEINYYIDLLLFNYIYNSFIVVELKITEIKAEYIGQIKKYMTYVDKNIKSINQNKTIGIIICRKENKFVMEYSSDERVISRKYILI